MSKSKILVVGGGISGLTAASALAQKGFAVDLIERNPELSDSGGIGLTLAANALRALDGIAAASDCLNSGIWADTQAIHTEDGTLVVELPLPRIGGPEFPANLNIRRANLHRALSKVAGASGVRVRCATTVEGWIEDADAVRVNFSDDSAQDYALMVGCDGVSSTLRKQIFPNAELEFCNAVVWRDKTPRPAGLDQTHVYIGSNKAVVGIVPLDDDTAYMYIGEGSEDASYRDEMTLHVQMRERLGAFGGFVADLAPHIDAAEKVVCRRIDKMLLPAPWYQGRIVLIGDAAHVYSPSLSQGAGMGIEDAIVLSDEVARSPDDIAKALAAFQERRFDRVKAVADASSELEAAKSQAELTRIRKGILEYLSEPI